MATSSSNSGSPLAVGFDMNDPLYLHPSDSITTSLTSCLLSGTGNYAIWSRAMLLALTGKNKIGFVLGTIPRPEDDPLRSSLWDRCNAIVLQWLLNSVSKELYSGLVFARDAAEVWQELKMTYDKVDASRMFSLYQDISNIKQGSDSVTTYYTKLKLLWDEYASLVAIPSCSCPSFEKQSQHNSNLKLMQFLMGLNDSFHAVRSSILLSSPIPTVMQAFNLVCQEEFHRSLNQSSAKTVSVFASQSDPDKPRLVCSHCGGKNHTMEKCYRLHGFPNKGSKKPNLGKGVKRSANMIEAEDGAADMNIDQDEPVALSKGQYEQLIKLLTKDTDPPSTSFANMAGFSNFKEAGDW